MIKTSPILIAQMLLLSTMSFAQNDLFVKGGEYFKSGEYQKASEIFESINNDPDYDILIKAKSHYYLSRSLWQTNDFQTSLVHGDKAIFIFDSLEESYWLGRCYYDLSMNNLVAGNYDLALLQTEKAYNAFVMARDTAFQIKTTCRRGLVFHDIGEYNQGVEACNKADTLHSDYSKSNADLQAIIWGIKAINYDDMGNSDKAVEIYAAILGLKEQLSSDREIIRTYNNMGNSLLKLGLLKEAKKYISLNLDANIRDKFEYGIATAKTNLGTIAYKEGHFKLSQNLLKEAEALSFEIADQEKIIDVLYQQFKLYEAMGEEKKALYYLNHYYHQKDSLYSMDKRRQIQFLEKRFETKQKEQEIEIQKAQLAKSKAKLQRNTVFLITLGIFLILFIAIALLNRNRIKKKQELILQKERNRNKQLELRAAIESEEKERSRYASDLHDGFGQLISILSLNLAQMDSQKNSEDEIKLRSASMDLIDNMREELRNICFNMMPHTLLRFGLPQVLEEFAMRVNSSGAVKLNIDVFGLEQRPKSALEISIYRIIQEWVNNILKYSEAKNISIQISADKEELTLLIEDDGSGFDKGKLLHSTGNGWKNINARVDLIHAKLELNTKLGSKGSSLILNCPLIHRDQNTMIRV